MLTEILIGGPAKKCNYPKADLELILLVKPPVEISLQCVLILIENR